MKLSQTPRACCLFNCYNCHTANYGNLLKAANEDGIDIRPVTRAAFDELMEEAMRDDGKRQGIGGLFSTVGMGTSSERLLTPVSKDYTTVLFNEGVYRPMITEACLQNFFDYLA